MSPSGHVESSCTQSMGEREGRGLLSLCGPRAGGRDSEAALQARSRAQHRIPPRALTFVEQMHE